VLYQYIYLGHFSREGEKRKEGERGLVGWFGGWEGHGRREMGGEGMLSALLRVLEVF